jgi:hypothetical protein
MAHRGELAVDLDDDQRLALGGAGHPAVLAPGPRHPAPIVELDKGTHLDGAARPLHSAYCVAPTRTGKFSVSSRYGDGT